jgi:hypothetical protein
MNLMEMGAMMADMPKFAAQAEDLIKSAKALTDAIDLYRRCEPIAGAGLADAEQSMYHACDAFKAKLAALPKLPGMTIDG